MNSRQQNEGGGGWEEGLKRMIIVGEVPSNRKFKPKFASMSGWFNDSRPAPVARRRALRFTVQRDYGFSQPALRPLQT